jgi:ferrochelatase
MDYRDPTFDHGEVPAVGVLLTNLGTPEAPTPGALRPYLKEFLSDPRVIELPRWKWLPILHLFVLTRRPRSSAALYARVWKEDGSPLLTISRRITAGIEDRLRERIGSPLHVALGMRYGEPSIAQALRELETKGCRRLLVLPLYPQYSASTSGTTFDAVAAELVRWRWVPELRTIHTYHDDPAYLDALAASVREVWRETGPPAKLLFSFHGVPKRYFEHGDPYHCLCHKTARGVAQRLELPRDRYEVSFQSRFGREVWLQPYTDRTIKGMARAGIPSLHVICPGFSADCLETLDEIDHENRKLWVESGGRDEAFRYLRALNDRADHLDGLTQLLLRNLGGWGVSREEWQPETAGEEAEASRRRAEELAAQPLREDAGYGTA